jgi:DNA-binding transcriptional regulator YiaG
MSGLAQQAKAARRLPTPPMRKAIRHEAGISLSVMAKELGVHPSCVARWEIGQRVPRFAIAAKYSELLRELQQGLDDD